MTIVTVVIETILMATGVMLKREILSGNTGRDKRCWASFSDDGESDNGVSIATAAVAIEAGVALEGTVKSYGQSRSRH